MGGSSDRRGAQGASPLKTLLVAGLLAVTLTVGLGFAAVGAAVVGVAGIAIGAAAGGAAVAHGACAEVESELAGDLGITVAELRAADRATLGTRIAARVAGGALTAEAARDAADLAEGYRVCTRVLGETDREWFAGERR